MESGNEAESQSRPSSAAGHLGPGMIEPVGTYRVARLRLRPGDIVLAKFKGRMPHSAVARIRVDLANLLEEAGHTNKVIVIDESADISVLAPQAGSPA